MHNLKAENYVLFNGISGDLSPAGGFSHRSEGLLQKGKGGARTYRSFCNKDQVVGTSKDDC